VIVFDMAYSLNATTKISADTYEEAEEKLKAQLKDKGINLETDFNLEVFDVEENHDNQDNIEEEKE
jgi:hypothetical protein